MGSSCTQNAIAPARVLRGRGAWQQAQGVQPLELELKFDCCEDDLGTLAPRASQAECDGVIAIGGGKVLDAGKLLAHRLGLPCITVPTSAATCAGWTALANLYSPQGAFRGDVALDRCPDLLIFDHDLVAQAPAPAAALLPQP